jgi:hypothetical protein
VADVYAGWLAGIILVSSSSTFNSTAIGVGNALIAMVVLVALTPPKYSAYTCEEVVTYYLATP